MASPVPLANHEAQSHRWELVPDSSNNMHLVDLNALEMPVEPLFNPDTDIILLLFTRLNPTVGQRLFMTLESLQNSNFNSAHPTRFTIHGWMGSQDSTVNVLSRAAYFQYGDFNVSKIISIYLLQVSNLINLFYT